jgi:hypothetical protein
MYAWLLPRIGTRAALVVTAIWYAALLVLVILCATEPPAEFRYDDL